MGNKRKKRDEDDYEYDPAPKHLQIGHIKSQEKRLIVILENSQLESVKVRLYFLLYLLIITNSTILFIIINYLFTFLQFYFSASTSIKHNCRLEIASNS